MRNLYYYTEHGRLPYWVTDSNWFGKLFYYIYPHAPRHGKDCSCNCGNWQERPF